MEMAKSDGWERRNRKILMTSGKCLFVPLGSKMEEELFGGLELEEQEADLDLKIALIRWKSIVQARRRVRTLREAEEEARVKQGLAFFNNDPLHMIECGFQSMAVEIPDKIQDIIDALREAEDGSDSDSDDE